MWCHLYDILRSWNSRDRKHIGDARTLEGVEGVEHKGCRGSWAGAPCSCLNCGESTAVCTSQSGGTDKENVLIDNHTLLTRVLAESRVWAPRPSARPSAAPSLGGPTCTSAPAAAALPSWTHLSPGSCEQSSRLSVDTAAPPSVPSPPSWCFLYPSYWIFNLLLLYYRLK